MVEEIRIKRLTTGTIFKILIYGSIFSISPFFLLMGVLSLFGASTILWNEQQLTGVSGLIASPFIGVVISLIFSGFFGLFLSAGLWIYSRFKPLTVHYWKASD